MAEIDLGGYDHYYPHPQQYHHQQQYQNPNQQQQYQQHFQHHHQQQAHHQHRSPQQQQHHQLPMQRQQQPRHRQQQHMQHHQQQQQTKENQPLTRVNGIGLWNSWTRNFKTPLLALLDLFDNSIDAAFVAPPARKKISATVGGGCEFEDGGVGIGQGGCNDDGGGGDDGDDGDGDILSRALSAAASSAAAAAAAAANVAAGPSSSFRGKIHVEVDEWVPPPPPLSSSHSSIGGGGGGGTLKVTGLKIINNSMRPIKSLGRIVEVYSSSKGRVEHGAITAESHMHEDFAETIGENGVGLKQGCATLSDLSFVLMRNGSNIGLAVIAARLQSPAGVYLPHVDFCSSADDLDGIRAEMTDFFLDESRGKVRECAEIYGEGRLDAGVDRLLGQFVQLTREEPWCHEENAFCVLLHHLKHGKKTYAPKSAAAAAASAAKSADGPASGDADDAMGSDAEGISTVDLDGFAAVDNDDDDDDNLVDAVEVDAEMAEDGEDGGENDGRALSAPEPTRDERYAHHALSLLQELKDELPRNYIHISSLMEVCVGGEVIRFHYWQRRLVELTSYTHIIDPVNSFTEAEDWKKPEKGYAIRLFCGFDSVRLTSGHHTGQCSLYMYSRLSGRLIKHEEDCRALLKLTSGGSHFSQGLTIIVDDADGNLPLNPTKQDVAFGEQAHGDVHKRNLYSWLGAITSVYYTYHLEANCSSKKGVLTRKVRAFGTPVIDPTKIKSLDQSEFTYMQDISWKLYQGGSIRIASKKALRFITGPDTVRRFKPDPRRERVHPVRKRRLSDEADDLVPVYDHDSPVEVTDENDAVGRLSASPEAVASGDIDPDEAVSSSSIRGSGGYAKKRRKVKTEDTASMMTPGSVKSSSSDVMVHSPRGGDGVNLLKIKILSEALQKHKEKSRERKVVVRVQDATIRKLKARIKEMEKKLKMKMRAAEEEEGNNDENVGGEDDDDDEEDNGRQRLQQKQHSPPPSSSSGKKSTRELVLEEQCDQLTAAVAAAQENEEEYEMTIQKLQQMLKDKDDELEAAREELVALREG